MLPDIFKNYFQKRSDTHQHNTINCYKLHVPRARTHLGKQTLKIRGAEYYNELSSLIKSFPKKYLQVFHQSSTKSYYSILYLI